MRNIGCFGRLETKEHWLFTEISTRDWSISFIRCFNNNFKHYRSEFTRYTKCALTNKTKQTSSQLCTCDDLIVSISILFIFLCQFAVSLIFVITTIIITIASPTRTDVFIIRIFTVEVLAIVPRKKKIKTQFNTDVSG